MPAHPLIEYFRRATYQKSVALLADLPPDSGREVVFAGRSNAGKSSAINALTGQTRLAHTSKTPGRTQTINFFGLDEGRRLVDLPGYGYAYTPRTARAGWDELLGTYLLGRQALRGVMLIMDIRHPFTELDEQLLAFLARRDLPLHVLLTKADKLTRGAAFDVVRKARSSLTRTAPTEVGVQAFSVLKRQGLEEAHETLARWLELERA